MLCHSSIARRLLPKLPFLALLLATCTSLANILPGTHFCPPTRYQKELSTVLSPENEMFHVIFPHNSPPGSPPDILVYIHSGDSFSLPADWERFVNTSNTVLVAPVNAGNNHSTVHRRALALLAAFPPGCNESSRKFVSGFSGGGRLAGQVCFIYPELFSGCIGICGLDLAVPSEHVLAGDLYQYGIFKHTAEAIERARRKVAFVILTGKGDFRYENLKKLRQYFADTQVTCDFLEYPNYGHQIPNHHQLLHSKKLLEKAIISMDASVDAKERQGQHLLLCTWLVGLSVIFAGVFSWRSRVLRNFLRQQFPRVRR